ncbi:hypothetical protein LINPERPRIM_LOCUS29222 [Linum perenne]
MAWDLGLEGWTTIETNDSF